MTALPLALGDTLASIGLPARAREKADLLAPLLGAVLDARNGERLRAADHAARQMRAAGYKMSRHGIRALAGRYAASGRDYAVLVDFRRVPHADKKLPPAFVEEVRRRFQLHKRSSAKAWETLIAEWRAGKPIVGYLTPPEADPFTGVPVGWSLKHLRRVCKSSAFERVAMRIGLGKAKAEHGPKTFTSRVGLWPFSHLMFDDVYHDAMVHVRTKNHRQLCRVAEIGCLDVLSGSRFAYGSVPLLKRRDGTTEGLKEAQMRFLLAGVLYNFGYSPRGTSLIVERGTATIREDIIAILHDRTGGVLSVDKGGWTGKEQAVAGMPLGNGGGNPRHKSLLESFHNLAHNQFAALPAQTGPDTDRRPEFLDGTLRESGQLLKIVGQLTPWQVERLQFPTLEYWTEFRRIAAELYRQIDFNPDHELEGWEKLGFLTRQMRFTRTSRDWLDEQQFLALPAGAQLALREIVRSDPACQQVRRLSRGEVFAQGRTELVPAPVPLIAEILYKDLARPRSCRNSYFEFEHEELDAELLRYESRVRTMDGREIELPDDTYEVVANPFDLSQLWVYSGKCGGGGFLGLARRDEAVSRADQDAIHRKLGRQQKRTADLRAPLLLRHANIAREETLRLKHNADVIEGPASEIEHQLAQDRADRAEPVTNDPPDFSAL